MKAFLILSLSACAAGLGLSPARSAAQETNGDHRSSLHEIDENHPDYRFLQLGLDVDYLEAERWRIIDQIESAIPPLYEPRVPFHGYTLPPGAWRFGFDVQYARNPSDFGTDEFYELFFDEVNIRFIKANLDLLYGFELFGVNDLVVRVNVPYKFQSHTGTGHPFRIDPMIMTMEGSGEGVGDISLTVKKKWLDQGNGPLTLSTMMGVIFPTGVDDEEFNASHTIVMGEMIVPVTADAPGQPIIDVFGRQDGDRLFPRIAQPGNGSWGGRVGFGASVQFDRSALHWGTVYDFFADNDGVTPGNELKYGVSYMIPVLPNDRVTLDLAFVGRLKGDESHAPEEGSGDRRSHDDRDERDGDVRHPPARLRPRQHPLFQPVAHSHRQPQLPPLRESVDPDSGAGAGPLASVVVHAGPDLHVLRRIGP